jgi:tRNA(fMet)-specific endonuclease VapC
MSRSVLDTDIFSEVLKGVDQRVAARAEAYRTTYGYYTISSITVMEIVKGFHKLQREDRIDRFRSVVSTVDLLLLDAPIAELAGRIYADLERTGQPIGWADPIIAACALHYGLVLVTGNTEHYTRIQAIGYNLQLDNWRT